MIPGLAQWDKVSGVAVSSGVGRRPGSEPTLLCLWCRREVVALIQPVAWELPHAAGVVQKKKKKKKERKKSCLRYSIIGAMEAKGKS